MAQTTVTVSGPELMHSITLKVRMMSLVSLRIRLAVPLMRLAAIVAGCQIDVSIEGDDAK